MPNNDEAKRILLVDDDRIVIMVLERSLEELNGKYIIETASNGEDAISKMNAQDYALLITDYEMPRMSGLELVKSIRTTHPHLPIVLMSAHDSDTMKDMVGNVQIDGYLQKPSPMVKIWEVVEQTIANKGANRF